MPREGLKWRKKLGAEAIECKGCTAKFKQFGEYPILNTTRMPVAPYRECIIVIKQSQCIVCVLLSSYNDMPRIQMQMGATTTTAMMMIMMMDVNINIIPYTKRNNIKKNSGRRVIVESWMLE